MFTQHFPRSADEHQFTMMMSYQKKFAWGLDYFLNLIHNRWLIFLCILMHYTLSYHFCGQTIWWLYRITSDYEAGKSICAIKLSEFYLDRVLQIIEFRFELVKNSKIDLEFYTFSSVYFHAWRVFRDNFWNIFFIDFIWSVFLDLRQETLIFLSWCMSNPNSAF